MPSPLRIGAVEYLNSKPLICDLDLLAPEAELTLDLPSRLADLLAAGELDVALIPVIEYFRGRHYSLVPNISIGSRGPVLSVTLFSKVPWDQIRTVALDDGSRTSAALTRILFAQRGHQAVRYRPFAVNQPAETVEADALLLIGDRAMREALPGFAHSYDLGQEWYEWSSLPAVFAVWAVRPGVDLGPVADALVEAKRRGLERVARIAHDEALRLGLDAAFCRRYLTNIIRFDLGPQELAGLQRFYACAVDLGLAPAGVKLDFHTKRQLVAAG